MQLILIRRGFLSIIFAGLHFVFSSAFAQTVSKPKTPMMGWSSWNNFRVNIDEKLIKEQADALVKSGLKNAGYNFINVDDGYFGGRNAKGELQYNKKRFPNGMKAIADYIHSKGLKAGIYTEAGITSCAAIWDQDTIGTNSGLYNHDEEDLTLFLKTWGYDFLKVDWCGAEKMNLNEQIRYTQIANWIKVIKPQVLYNICRWKFPGEWAPLIADSWRVSGDIANNFKSILHIINQNADLWRYCSPGHFNDMDILQVGRGMTFEEDKTHFSLWCMMNSPLLLGNDLRSISKQTLSIVTNKELIDLNQDPFCYQARRLQDSLGVQFWAKPLASAESGEVAVALLNTNNVATEVILDIDKVGIDTKQAYVIRDLWKHENITPSPNNTMPTFSVPAHGVMVFKISGKSLPFNIFERMDAKK